MKFLGLALQQEPIKGRSRKLKGEPFKVAKGASSARSGRPSPHHKGDSGSFFNRSMGTIFVRSRVGLLAGSARTDDSARTEVGSSVDHTNLLESGYASEIEI
jgi:hypothetical protein